MANASEATKHTGLEQVFDNGRWDSYRKYLLLLATVAFVVEGFALQAMGVVIPALSIDWNLPRSAFTVASIIGLVGWLIGNTVGGIIGDRIGRKWSIIGSTMLYGVMDLVAMLISNTDELGMVRFMAGLGVGAMTPNTIAFIAETTPAHRRARAIGIAIIGLVGGAGLAGYIGSLLLPTFGWRAIFFLGGAVPIAFAIMLVFTLPESPAFLARFPKKRGQLKALLARMSIALPDNLVLSAPGESKRVPISALFSGGMAINTIGLWGVGFFSHMANQTFLNWGPAMFAGYGFDLRLSSLSLTFWSLGAIGSIVLGLAIERFGSRSTLIVFGILAVVTSILLAVLPLAPSNTTYLFTGITILGVCVVVITTSVNVLGQHTYPASFRTTGLGVSAAVGRVGSIIGVTLSDISLNLNGSFGFFLFIGAAFLMSGVFGLFLRTHMTREGR